MLGSLLTMAKPFRQHIVVLQKVKIDMCHGQNMVWFPIEGDGHPTIDTDLDTQYKDSYSVINDKKHIPCFGLHGHSGPLIICTFSHLREVASTT